jgi:LmbE family N-acetylglucosaminyl deacetylase
MRRDGRRLVIVMPHPDDECFGCASTLARYSIEGATVSQVTMTRGGAGLWSGRAAGDLRRLADVRELELRTLWAPPTISPKTISLAASRFRER